MGTISLPFMLPEFSDKCQCTQEFMVADKLVHPVILGTEFMQQEIVLDYKRKVVQWDGLEIPMKTNPEPLKRVTFAVQDPDGRTMRILDIEGKEIKLEALVPKEHLTPEEKERLLEVLRSFRVINLGGIGKLKLKPYVLPVKKGSVPQAQRPYPIPLILQEPTLREVERLVKLGCWNQTRSRPGQPRPSLFRRKTGLFAFLPIFEP
ncbi:hypothetical protein PI125_g6627 [Phytophthora idaei]|nr:hypothetical protein PI125_g6627 [Phytophthora idaei]KAG3157085.1 hypothetical protein PI126_g8472 [Phytophthora idaei]